MMSMSQFYPQAPALSQQAPVAEAMPGAAGGDMLMANLAQALAAQNTAPASPVMEPAIAMPQTYEEAMGVIEAQKQLIADLSAQLQSLNPDAQITPQLA